MAMSARAAALTALERCRRSGAWSDAVLSSVIRTAGLDRRDAALCARLCYGVQQNSLLCDFYIDAYSSVKTPRMEPKLRDILRLAVYSLLLMDRVPAHAAVSEAVEQTKAAGLGRAAGLVNAVLRRISEHRDDLPEIPGAGTAAGLSIRYSHPLWLAEEYVAQLGYAQAQALLAANNAAPPICAQVNTLKTTAAQLIEQGAIAHPWLPDCVEISAEQMELVERGLAYVQDPAARLAVMAAAPEPGMSVLDACAAPGGKSFAAGIRMQNRGSILACDLHEKKLSRVRQSAQRLGLDILDSRAMDARTPEPALCGAFDLVLADVPCSGLGVIRKKPDIRFKPEPELSALPEIQLDILRGLAGCVKPGGVLLYSTCTTRERENAGVCRAFLAENDAFQAEGFALPEPVGAAAEGMLSLWPHIHGTDGFFLCKMRKKT